jgi:hypothetical protein
VGVSLKGESLIEELLCEGRLTLTDLERRVVSREMEFRRRACLEVDHDKNELVTRTQTRELIARLVKELYIVRVPPLDTTRELHSSNNTTSSSKLNEAFHNRTTKVFLFLFFSFTPQ